MNLSHFEDSIDDVILERGEDYFNQGNVKKINEVEPNRYLIEVIGSEPYAVDIFLNEDEDVVETTCDCPYDWGEFCKHQVAAFFALRNKRNVHQNQTNVQTPSNQKVDLNTILANLEKEEIIRMMISISEEYPEIKSRLLFKYSPSENVISTSKKLVKKYINQYKHRGFIEWNHVSSALTGAYMVLNKAEEKIVNDEVEIAVSLSLVVLANAMDMLNYSDDSSGNVGSVIINSLDTIYEAVSYGVDKINEDQKERIFSTLMKEALHRRYEGWAEWQIDLLKSTILLSDTKGRRQKLERRLNKMLETATDHSWGASYVTENIQLLQYELIERFDDEEKRRQFYKANIHNKYIREKVIKQLLEKGEYEEVIGLCELGIKIDENNGHLVQQWKKYQLQAYEGLGDTANKRKLMLDFLYHNEFQYYPILKTLYEPNEWELVLNKILETFEKKPYLPIVYLEIIKEEKMIDKILAYCEDEISTIEELYPYLIESHFEDVRKLFVQSIKSQADQSSNRKEYRRVCKLIKLFKKVCGDEPSQVIIDELKQTNKRRPAFVDELGKIK
ncbi:hypothetical protein J2S13_003252 [Oikeobacillus pervagus]|uniref:SWIM-type domain-containing protein n=1 Tax=Oikeobacillus pervagus TaxID=1325931 RepID=A0AAJ1WKQ3_9BACI|nr:hypothetical protein [Oikeobacillus pervagus]MDQ0216768.1 hypothetical protein [Oikeobacillus pervagus]